MADYKLWGSEPVHIQKRLLLYMNFDRWVTNDTGQYGSTSAIKVPGFHVQVARFAPTYFRNIPLIFENVVCLFAGLLEACIPLRDQLIHQFLYDVARLGVGEFVVLLDIDRLLGHGRTRGTSASTSSYV